MPQISPDKLLVRLIDNALDFAADAAQAVGKNPRQSVLSFAASVELIFKARLFCEHWTLILDKPGKKSLRHVESGEFKSVTWQEAIARLETVAGETLTEHEFKKFARIASHRNKCIHFFHPEYAAASDESVASVVAEQFAAWFYLHRLMTGRWKTYFSHRLAKITEIDKAIRKNKHYLQGRYDALQPEIKATKKLGEQYTKCPTCSFLSLHVDDSAAPLYHRHCKVCDAWHDFLLAECTGCEHDIRIEGDGEGTCEECGENIGMPELLDQFGEALKPGDCGAYSDGIHCSYCCRWDAPTVVPWNGGFLCLSCLEESDSVAACEWCNNYYLGFDPDGSFYMGCELCEGRSGGDDD